jgi:PilZ domain
MSERRRSMRQKSFLRGCVYFNKRRQAVDCLIRDISDEGARIIFSDTVSVPDRVDLYIPQKEQTIRAHVQWRHGDEIGLAFPDTASDEIGSAPAGNLAQRMSRLELEVAALRKVLRRLQSSIKSGDDVDAA